MTGRERVKACLGFAKPDRAPRDLWALPYVLLFQRDEMQALLEEYPMDIGRPQASPGQTDETVRSIASAGHYQDEWGSVWHVGEPGVVGEVKEPALAEWGALDNFRPPWHLIRERDLSEFNRLCETSSQFMLSDCVARPFERLQFLRGTENLLIDIAYDTVGFRKLLLLIHEFFLEDVARWCCSNADGIVFMDDWGSNQSLLINPETWRQVFKPLYREYCACIHSSGKAAFFHSDGNIEAIFGDLLEVGVDAINSQLFVMNIEGLARRYKGKVTFWGEIDRQRVLPFGAPSDVRQAVRRIRRAFDDGNGGVIAQCEWGKDNPTANVKAVFEAWNKQCCDRGLGSIRRTSGPDCVC